MKIWLTGSQDEVQTDVAGLASAIVTNPSVIKAWTQDQRTLEDVIADVTMRTNLPLFVQLYGPTYERFIAEFKYLQGKSELVRAKLPATLEGIKATKTLGDQGEEVLVTAVSSLAQAYLAATAGAAYICPYYARLNDSGYDAKKLIHDTFNLYKRHALATEIVPASIRSVIDLSEVLEAGASGAILPFDVLLTIFEHPVLQTSMQGFEGDWQEIDYSFRKL